MANVLYETQDGPKMMKRAIAFARLYNNVLYTVECSAEESVYEKWHNSFLSFIKSVNLEAHTNFAVEGYYRSFLDDCLLKIKGETVLDDTYY